MRITQDELPAFISTTLLNIRAGVQAARDQGLQADLPEKVDFSVEVIQSRNTLSLSSTSETAGTRSGSQARPITVDTTRKSGGGQVTHDAVVETGTRTATSSKHESTTETRNMLDTTASHVVVDEGSDSTITKTY